MLRQSRKPYGFKDLLVYKKSEELQKECSLLTTLFPHYQTPSAPSQNPINPISSPLIPLKTIFALADQMNRSARSVKQNIVEGWKHNSTNEYYEFLGFSIGALTELEEDCNDIWNEIYPDLMGIKGVIGAKGIENKKGVMGVRGAMGVMGTPSNPLKPLKPPLDIEKIPFYPLDKNLPSVIQLKLRCKELNYLLKKLQDSLSAKMKTEKTLSVQDKLSLIKNQQQKADQFEKEILEKYGVQNKRE